MLVSAAIIQHRDQQYCLISNLSTSAWELEFHCIIRRNQFSFVMQNVLIFHFPKNCRCRDKELISHSRFTCFQKKNHHSIRLIRNQLRDNKDLFDIDLHLRDKIMNKTVLNRLFNLVSTEKETGVNAKIVLLCLTLLKKIIFFKWPVVGLKAPVVGLSPTMPYPGYATSIS